MTQIEYATFEIFAYIHAYSEKCKKLTQLWKESCYDATLPSCKCLAIPVWADAEICDDLGKPAAPRGPGVGDLLLGTAVSPLLGEWLGAWLPHPFTNRDKAHPSQVLGSVTFSPFHTLKLRPHVNKTGLCWKTRHI